MIFLNILAYCHLEYFTIKISQGPYSFPDLCVYHSLLIYSSLINHIGFLATPWSYQKHPLLRTFAFAVLFSWNTCPPESHMTYSLTSSRFIFVCHLLSESLPDQLLKIVTPPFPLTFNILLSCFIFLCKTYHLPDIPHPLIIFYHSPFY